MPGEFSQNHTRARPEMPVLRSASGLTCRLGCDSARDVSEGGSRVSNSRHLMAKRTPTTRHRLIRCAPSAVLDTAYSRHTLVADRAFDTLQHWRRPTESERGNAVHWYDHVPVIGDVGCCLSVDQAANGAVAHLTATASHRRGVLPKPLVRLALSSWSHHKLLDLARATETEAHRGCNQNFLRSLAAAMKESHDAQP